MTDIDYTSSWRDLNSIGYGLFIDTGYIYPMKESGGYEIENGLALSEADDLSMLSKDDKGIIASAQFRYRMTSKTPLSSSGFGRLYERKDMRS